MFRTRTHVGVYVADAPGPIARSTAILPHLRSDATLLSRAMIADDAVSERVLRVRLPGPDGDPGRAARGAVPTPRSLGSEGARELLVWMEQESPDLLFVDGPPDVAIFARLAGIPVVLLRRHGRRTPAQEELLDRATLGMLAPYPEDLEISVPRGASATVHTGLLSRFAGRTPDRERARRRLGIGPDERLVTVLGGHDGLGVDEAELAASAAATPGWRWHALGASDLPEARPAGALDLAGWVADPWPHLVAADVIITGGSPSAVAEAADANVPLIVVPRRSADAEERCFADALGGVGAAVPLVGWPRPERWSATLDAAAQMDPSLLASRCDGRAANRAAEWLDAWAAMPSPASDEGPEAAGADDLLADLELA